MAIIKNTTPTMKKNMPPMMVKEKPTAIVKAHIAKNKKSNREIISTPQSMTLKKMHLIVTN
jgi:hypothetical protein